MFLRIDKFSKTYTYFLIIFQVDLGKESVVTGVITQGGENYIRWYTSLQISYSVDNQKWTYALEKECGSRRVSILNHGYNDF